eukprot:Gb_07523 [translate_table: standard]
MTFSNRIKSRIQGKPNSNDSCALALSNSSNKSMGG